MGVHVCVIVFLWFRKVKCVVCENLQEWYVGGNKWMCEICKSERQLCAHGYFLVIWISEMCCVWNLGRQPCVCVCVCVCPCFAIWKSMVCSRSTRVFGLFLQQANGYCTYYKGIVDFGEEFCNSLHFHNLWRLWCHTIYN